MATSDWDIWRTRDGVKKRAIWVAFALSLLIHAAALWQWLPHLRLSFSELAERRDASGPLSVQLAPPPSPRAPAPAPSLQSRQQPKPERPKAESRARPAPPVIALNKQALDIPSPRSPSTIAAPTPTRPPVEGDLSSYIEARRRARAESAPAPAAADVSSSAPPAEDDNARANRIAAANLGIGRKPTFGPDPTHGGGIFSIQRLGYDYAEFIFFGWNKDIRRNTSQVIEVRKGNNSDIRIAVVRRMIAIIREYEQEDFIWESKRLGRDLTLSARARDNAGLEDFMMREFFGNYTVQQ